MNSTTLLSTRSNYQDAAEDILEGRSTTKEEYPFVDQDQDTFPYKRNVKEPKQVTIKAEQDIIMSDPDQTAARALAQVEALQKELESHLPDTLQEIKNSHSGTQQQVNEISSSLALLVTQMHQLSNSMEVVTQSMSHEEGSKGKDLHLGGAKHAVIQMMVVHHVVTQMTQVAHHHHQVMISRQMKSH